MRRKSSVHKAGAFRSISCKDAAPLGRERLDSWIHQARNSVFFSSHPHVRASGSSLSAIVLQKQRSDASKTSTIEMCSRRAELHIDQNRVVVLSCPELSSLFGVPRSPSADLLGRFYFLSFLTYVKVASQESDWMHHIRIEGILSAFRR